LFAFVLISGARVSPRASTVAGSVLTVRQILPDVPKPVRAQFDQKGQLYILSGGNSTVEVYGPDLKLVRRIGRLGNGPGELYGPMDLSITPSGEIWVAERGNNRLEKFSSDGHVLHTISTPEPVSVTVGPDGQLAVVGARDNDLVKLYSSSGELLGKAGEFVNVPGATDFQNAFFNKGRVFAFRSGFLYVYRYLPQPLVREYSWTGKRLGEWRPDGIDLIDAITQAQTRQKEALKTGGAAARSVLNALEVDRRSGHVWIAPAAPVFYVYNSAGQKIDEKRVQDLAGQPYGAHDVALAPDGRSLVMISGALLMKADLGHEQDKKED
jgi:DNA-binding beta-propeller fold protein YncE